MNVTPYLHLLWKEYRAIRAFWLSLVLLVMVSTTYVQFLKGSLLVLFGAVLTVMILNRGLTTQPTNPGYRPPRVTREVAASPDHSFTADDLGLANSEILPAEGPWSDRPYLRTREANTGVVTVWRKTPVSARFKPASEKGTVPFYSEDSAKLGQSRRF